MAGLCLPLQSHSPSFLALPLAVDRLLSKALAQGVVPFQPFPLLVYSCSDFSSVTCTPSQKALQ